MNMNLSEYLEYNGHNVLKEIHCQEIEGQTAFLKKMVSQKTIRDVMEIGFNAGHSAEVFLSTNPNIKVTSFELGKYSYTQIGKSFIDMRYPFRHQLVLGDSTSTILEYQEIFPDKKFDLIFIDGGHDYQVILKDIHNCKQFAHKGTVLIVNGIIYNPEWVKPWTLGPSHAWADVTDNGLVTDADTCYEEYGLGRGIAWGKYNVDFVKKSNKTVKNYSS